MNIFTMDAFDAYKSYLAIKSHFTTKHYDYFKYNGQVKAKRESFDCRKDKYFFHKLSKRKDLIDFLVALFVYGKKDMWVGDIVRNEETEELYKQWQKVKESITYVFKNDLDLIDSLSDAVQVIDGQHPLLLKFYLQNQIHIETLIILNDIVGFSKPWSKHIQDSVVWPEVKNRCKKYHPFVKYDREKCAKIVVDKFGVFE